MRLRQTLTAAVAAVILTGCGSQALPQPVAAYQSRGLDMWQPKNDGNVMATADVATTHGTSVVDEATICAVNSDGERFDITPYLNLERTLTESWLHVVETKRYPAGEYTAWVCVFDDNHEQAVSGESVAFTVQ